MLSQQVIQQRRKKKGIAGLKSKKEIMSSEIRKG
jgi:hypothetical protein